MVALRNHTSARTLDTRRRESKGRSLAEYYSPLGGFIFVCNNATVPDLDRQIFGLPGWHVESVRAIRKGMPLFLYNYSTRLLHGIFEAASNGGYNLDPYAWENTDMATIGKAPVSRYPAQVKVQVRALRPPLDEETFRPVLDHQEGNKFRLELSQVQVQQLLRLFGANGFEAELELGDDLNVDSIFHHLHSSQEPESPNGVCKSDLDSCSVSSNSGNNLYEDEWPDESDYDVPLVRGPAKSKSYNSLVQEYVNHRNLPLKKGLHNSKACSEKQVSKGHPNLSYSAALMAGMHTTALENRVSRPSDDHQTISKENRRRHYHRSKPESLSLADQNLVVLRLQDVDPAVNSDVIDGMHLSRHQAVNSKGRGTRVQAHLPQSKVQPSLTRNDKVPITAVRSQQTGAINVRESSQKGNDGSRTFVCGLSDQQFKQSVTQEKVNGTGVRSNSQKQRVALNVEKVVHLPGFQPGEFCAPVCVQSSTVPVSPPEEQGCMKGLVQPVFFSPPDATPIIDSEPGTEDVPEICEPVTDANRDDFEGLVLPSSWGLQVPVLLMPSFVQRIPEIISTAELNMGALHYEILEFAKIARPSVETRLHAEAAIGCVRKGVRAVWPDADVEVFGSFATGLCLRHSDIDLAVVDAPVRTSKTSALSVAQASALLIRELSQALKAYYWCERLTVIDTASMPVLKCCCRPADSDSSVKSSLLPPVAIDITIGGMKGNTSPGTDSHMRPDSAHKIQKFGKFGSKHTGGAAREYVIQRLKELPALFPLVLLLKSYLHHKGLSDVYSGGLGSFSLTLLLAFFLERVPIPCEAFQEAVPADGAPLSPTVSSPLTCASEFSLDSDTTSCTSGGSGASSNSSNASSGIDHGIDMMGEFLVRRAADVADKVLSMWHSGGSPLLGTLLLGFLQTFGFELDLSMVKVVLKGADGKGGIICRDSSTRHMALWIDDPLRPGVNVGAGSYGMCHVQSAFREMLQILTNRQFYTLRSESPCDNIPDIESLYYLSGLFEADDY